MASITNTCGRRHEPRTNKQKFHSVTVRLYGDASPVISVGFLARLSIPFGIRTVRETLESVVGQTGTQAAEAAPADLRGALEAFGCAAQASRETTIRRHVPATSNAWASGLDFLCAQWRQGELKGCTLAEIARGPNPSAVSLDDRMADRKSHAHPVGLGGVERVEHAVHSLGT